MQEQGLDKADAALLPVRFDAMEDQHGIGTVGLGAVAVILQYPVSSVLGLLDAGETLYGLPGKRQGDASLARCVLVGKEGGSRQAANRINPLATGAGVFP